MNKLVVFIRATFWATTNPKEIMEVPLHSPKVTAWCALTERTIIGPFFLRDSKRSNNYCKWWTMWCNAERIFHSWSWQHEFSKSFLPARRSNLSHYESQHVNSSRPFSKTSHLTICRRRAACQVPWFIPLYFFLWGYLKSTVYRENPTTLDQLKEAIRTEIGLISSEMTAKWWEICENVLIYALYPTDAIWRIWSSKSSYNKSYGIQELNDALSFVFRFLCKKLLKLKVGPITFENPVYMTEP